MTEPECQSSPKRTQLYDLHRQHGGRMVSFAGYEMPLQFTGVKAEHLWTRTHAGLFDIGHMGPCFLSLRDKSLKGEAAHTAIASVIEQVVPGAISTLKPGQARLSVLLADDGGILDDLIITRPNRSQDQGTLYIVLNGAVKDRGFQLLRHISGERATLHTDHDRDVLMALQGPAAEAVLADYLPGHTGLAFMHSHITITDKAFSAISRCGYTGEDGFELLLSGQDGVALAHRLLADSRVKPVGLGARDSLRLEAGLCLYGQDIDPGRDPVMAGLQWVIAKNRRERGDFPGAQRILDAITNGPAEKRVGIEPLGPIPARAGTIITAKNEPVGIVTSGGFGPSLNRPVAMGYIRTDLARPGVEVALIVRGKALPARICALPFVKPRYKR